MPEKSDTIKIINLGKTVEAAPGKQVAPIPEISPKFGIFKLIPIGGNEYRAQIETRTPWIRLTPSVPRELGLGIEYRTLKRLILAGFVLGQKVAPNCWQFSLQSYFEHLERARLDPEFWDENNPAGNLARYKEFGL